MIDISSHRVKFALLEAQLLAGEIHAVSILQPVPSLLACNLLCMI
jgi:hypothetical protein